MVKRLIVFCLLLVATTGLFASDESAKVDLVITLQRTACFGTCPVYKLTIRGDGSVTYEGRKYVRIVGTRQSTIDRAAVAKLVQEFADAGYFGFGDRYRSRFVSDQPTVFTSLTMSGRRKSVEDYWGAPAALKALEQKIDDLAGSKKWILIDAASVHEEVQRGWNVRGPDAQRLLVQAAEAGDVDVVRAFIEEGADVNARDRNGDDALSYARRGLAYQEDTARQRLHPEDSVKDYEEKYKDVIGMLTAMQSKSTAK